MDRGCRCQSQRLSGAVPISLGPIAPQSIIVEVKRTADPAPLARGIQAGTAQDGDSITFDEPFDEVPQVFFTHRGISYKSSGLTGDQRLNIEAVGLSPTGFTLRARISELIGSLTGRTASFSGDTATKSETAEAWDDIYTFQYDVTLGASSNIHLSFWTRPSGGSWTQRATRHHFTGPSGGKTVTNAQVPVTVDGLGANAEFKITIESETGTASLTRDPVSWDEATAPTDSDATSGTDTVVGWIAIEGS